jgi:hypothetical protein
MLGTYCLSNAKNSMLNLYDSLVKCIQVATDDIDGKGLAGGNDKDVYEHWNILRMQSKNKGSVLTPGILTRK